MPEEEASEATAPKTATPKTRAAPKPRVVQRKTKAERDEHARKEAERAKERETAEATPAPKASTRGGRGGARGGRGGIKQNERSTVPAGAGVFGAGRGERPDRARGPVDLGVSEALDGYSGSGLNVAQTGGYAEGSGGGTGGGGDGGGGGGGGGRGRGFQQDGDIAIPQDEDMEDVGRRDIERIWISSDEDEDVIVSRKGKQRQVSKPPKPGIGLRPVRAARTIVEEDPDGQSDKKLIKKISNDNAVIDVDTDEMQIDEVPKITKKDPPSSPEMSKKILRKSDSKPRDSRILTETIEERAERLRLREDAQGLRDAFTHKSDTDDTIDSKEEEVVFGRTDHDRMFLFQLPPLIPQLRNPDIRPAQGTEAMNVDQENVQVKTEPGIAGPTTQKEEDRAKTSSDVTSQTFTAELQASQRLPPGLVGKLKIHKSGKVTLDWGGTDMEVRYGTEVDFLQDVIYVENPELAEADEHGHRKGQTGKAYALGQVQKKMVLIPDWSKLYA